MSASTFIPLAVPLSQLVIDETNARHDSPPDHDIASLAASIGEVGLLQPILVVARGDQYGVVAGRRRFLATLQLTGQESVPLEERLGTIAALQIDEAQALDVSLIENYARMKMDTKELYGAFKRLADAGRTIEQIAATLNYEPDRVKRILRLSNLHPELMDAWNEGDLGDAEAQAFAFVDDPELQLRTAKKIRKEYSYSNDKTRFRLTNMAHLIKRQLKAALKGQDYDERKLAYIGIEAYKEAGGRLHEDLFGDDVVILDPELVERLGDEKLAAEQADALTHMMRIDDSDLNVEWVGEDQLPKINLYGYDQVDAECFISPGTAEDGKVVLPAGGKILARAMILHDGETMYKLYWASRADGGIPEPKQKNHKTSASSTTATKSPGELLKAESGAASRNAFLALQVMFGDAIADMLLVDAKEMVGEKAETEGLYSFLFVMAWTLARVGSVTGFPSLREPERGPHQVRELLEDKEHGNRDLLSLLPDATWLDAPTLVEGFDGYWGWISTNNAARLGAALLGRTWSPVANNFREEETPTIVKLVAEHANADFTQGQLAAQIRDRQAKAVELISHKARLAAMESWGVPADQLKPLRKATSAEFMQRILADPDRRKLLGMTDEQQAAALAWLPNVMRTESVERPKPKAPKADKPKAKSKTKTREVEPA